MVAPPKRRNWLPLVVLLAIVAVIGVGFYVFRDRLSGGVTGLQVGDCIDEPAVGTTSVSDVQHQPCTDPHDAEVFLLVTDPATGGYPGADHFRSIANDQCASGATSFLGTDYNARDDIGGGFFYPSSDSWGTGDRTITCYLDRTDGVKLAGSLRGIGSSPVPAPRST